MSGALKSKCERKSEEKADQFTCATVPKIEISGQGSISSSRCEWPEYEIVSGGFRDLVMIYIKKDK